MNPPKQAPREWWIAVVYEDQQVLCASYKAALKYAWRNDPENVLHVVEMSALLEAEKEIERLRSMIGQDHANRFIDNRNEHREDSALKALLAEAETALQELVSQHMRLDNGDSIVFGPLVLFANNTLNKLKALKCGGG